MIIVMIKLAFGWGKSDMVAAVREMLNCGECGLDGFIHFIQFFVVERGLSGVLIETKVSALLKELE